MKDQNAKLKVIKIINYKEEQLKERIRRYDRILKEYKPYIENIEKTAKKYYKKKYR